MRIDPATGDLQFNSPFLFRDIPAYRVRDSALAVEGLNDHYYYYHHQTTTTPPPPTAHCPSTGMTCLA